MLQASLAKVPAIVPPTAFKLLSTGGIPADGFVEDGHARAMKSIWAAAVGAVANADEVVVVGYSLPGTDAASIALLKNAFRRRRTSSVLFLVDPSKAVAERYEAILGVHAKVVGDDFNTFDPSKPLA